MQIFVSFVYTLCNKFANDRWKNRRAMINRKETVTVTILIDNDDNDDDDDGFIEYSWNRTGRMAGVDGTIKDSMTAI